MQSQLARRPQAADRQKLFAYPLEELLSQANLAELSCLLGAQFLEADPTFNAGFGSALQEDGQARVSASFMESSRLKHSGVVNVEGLLHPSLLSYYLQTQRFSVLDGLGAVRLARRLNWPWQDLIADSRFQRWLELKQKSAQMQSPQSDGTGTIGVVSVTSHGELAACTSTGGVGFETPGRIGDTPTTAGNYCSRRVAASCTGFGEQIVNLGFANRVAVRVEDGLSLAEAMRKSFAEAQTEDYEFAAIAVAYSPERNQLHWAAAHLSDVLLWTRIDLSFAL